VVPHISISSSVKWADCLNTIFFPAS